MSRPHRAKKTDLHASKDSSASSMISGEMLTPRREVRDPVVYAAYSLLVLFVVMLCLSKLYDDDVFWQLATGRWIVQHQSIPERDVFGFVTEGQQWIPVEWLWGIILYASYTLTQSLGTLEILASLICAGVMAFQLSIMHRHKIAKPVTIIVASLVIFTMLGRLLPRPHIVTALGLSITVFAVYRFRLSERSKFLFFLPVVFLFWTNMHPGVLVGLMLLGVAVAAEAVRFLLARNQLPDSSSHIRPPSVDSLRKLGAVFLICIGAVLVNPHGINTYLYVYQHAQMAFLGAIKEWDSPFSATATMGRLWFYKILLILGCASIYYSIKKRDPLPAALYLAFAIYSFQAVRLRVDFALVTAPGTALALHDLALRIQIPATLKFVSDRSMTIALAILLAIMIVLIPAGTFYKTMNMENHFGLGLDSAAFPVRMLDFMRKEEIRGRPFNEFGIGGILVWEFSDAKNFIDSRDLNDTILSEYISMYNMQAGFEKKFEQYGIDHVMIYIPGLQKDADLITTSPIPYFSTHRDEWKLVYWNDQSSLYLKNIPKFHRVIEQYEYKMLHPYLFAYEPRVFDSLRAALPDQFQKELRRKLDEEPDGRVVRFIAREVGYTSAAR